MRALIAILLYGYGVLMSKLGELIVWLAWRNHPILRALSRLVPLNWLLRRTIRLMKNQGLSPSLDWVDMFRFRPDLIESLDEETLEKTLEVLKDEEKYAELAGKFPFLKEFEGLGATRQQLAELLENEKFLREYRRRYVASTVDPEGRES